jgi:hypothetical protein
MTQEVELQIGIPDYYRDDRLSDELDKYIEDMLNQTDHLGMNVPYYLLEFCE